MQVKTASHVMTFCLFVYMCLQPLSGMLSDRIGRRNGMLLSGGLGVLGTAPILATPHHVTNLETATPLDILPTRV